MKFSAIFNLHLPSFLAVFLVTGLYLACAGENEQAKPEENNIRQELQAKIVYYAMPG